MNAAQPPDVVVLYCLRSDPSGGGSSILAPVQAVDDLDPDDLAELKRHIFSDGVVHNLDHIGEDINPFAVVAANSPYPLRWTQKLLESTQDPRARTALQHLTMALDRCTVEVTLRPGQMLLINQRRCLHGRRTLGDAQAEMPAAQRRLLMHAFGRLER